MAEKKDAPKRETTNGTREGNLALWNRLYKTDPAHTKSFKRAGGFSGTAIKPFWAMKRATEEFGPVGIGWGWDEVEHQTFVMHDGRAIWFSKVVVWYCAGDGERHEVGPQWGATELVANRKDGQQFLDEEAAKKAVTDGITKCLSYLGLGGDVHMGQFDDSKYVAEVREEYAKQAAAEKAEKADPGDAAWRDRVLAHLKDCATIQAVHDLWKVEGPIAREVHGRDPKLAKLVKSEVERKLAEMKNGGEKAAA